MRRKLSLLFLILLGLDQLTKLLVREQFELYESIPVVDGFFNLTYVLNPGAAFGMLGQLPELWRKWFFVAVTLIAIAAVVYLMYHERQHILRVYAYTCILSGAVGNFIDRVFIGKVVDFLDFYIGTYHWPAFNIADSAITVGIGLIILDILISKREDHGQEA